MYFIIGASGFIGQHLYDYCKEKEIDVFGTFYRHSNNPELVQFDLCIDDLYSICHKYCAGKIPQVVIICGANSSIDNCKRDETASYNLNVIGIKKILDQANKMGIKSVFLSSEAVFDGKQGMYSEEDIPNPITTYGRQKLQIERYMMQNLKDYLIFRISRAAGSSYGEKDIFDEFYNKIINKEEIVCLKNQSFCLTEINDITEGIIKALQHGLTGLYHLSSANYISRYELAHLYAKKMFGQYEKIVEKEYDDFPFLDNRHIYGGLKGNKLVNLLEIRYMDIDSMLNKYRNTYKKGAGLQND